MRIVFVSPAWRRYGMSRAVLPQRLWLHSELEAAGIEARSLVVSDDENLAIAEGLGLDVLRAPNLLGRRFNDGIAYACSKLGADYVCLIGSDQWVHPGPIARHLPDLGDRIGTAAALALVDEAGSVIRYHECDYPGMAGPRIYPRALLKLARYRPCPDRIMRGCDSGIARGIARAARHLDWRRGGPAVAALPWVPFDDPALGALYNVDFKSPVEQLHRFDGLLWERYVTGSSSRPWVTLRRAYPAPLVEGMRALYAERRAAARSTEAPVSV